MKAKWLVRLELGLLQLAVLAETAALVLLAGYVLAWGGLGWVGEVLVCLVVVGWFVGVLVPVLDRVERVLGGRP